VCTNQKIQNSISYLWGLCWADEHVLIELNARTASTREAHTVGDNVHTTSGKENTGSSSVRKRKKKEGK
jgi:hypothetical protein